MEFRENSGHDFFATRQRMNDARLKMTFVKRYDELIAADAELDRATDLSADDLVAWRKRFGWQYQQYVGVPMELRDVLMERLGAVVETGAETVEDVIADLNANYRYGSSSLICSPGRLSGRPSGGVS